MFPTSQYMQTDQAYTGAPVLGAMVSPAAAQLGGSVGGSYRAALGGSGSGLALLILFGVCLVLYHMR